MTKRFTSVDSSKIPALDKAMREYFEAEYKFARAAYADKGFDLSEGRKVLPLAQETKLRERVEALGAHIDEAWFSTSRSITEHLREEARALGKEHVRGGVDAQKGLRIAQTVYTKTASFEAIATVDDYNPSLRGGGKEYSHAELLTAARTGQLPAQEVQRTSAPVKKPAPEAKVSPQEEAKNNAAWAAALNVTPEQFAEAKAAVSGQAKPATSSASQSKQPAAKATPAASGAKPAAAPAASSAAPVADASDSPTPAPVLDRTGTYERIDPAIQLKLEQLGHSTGTRNTKKFNAKGEQAALDGLLGPKTKSALKTVLGRDITFPLNETVLAELNTKLTEQLAARQQQGQGGTQVAQKDSGQSSEATKTQPADGASSLPGVSAEVKAQVAAALAANTQDQTDNNYTGYTTQDALPGMFTQLTGQKLSQQQISRMTMKDGIIHSEDILQLEKALNRVRGDAPAMVEDGKWDARLTQLAQAEGMKTFIGAVFNPTQVADNAAPSSTPGTGGGGRQMGS